MSYIVSFATAARSILYLALYGFCFFGLSSRPSNPSVSPLSPSLSKMDRPDNDEEPPESCRTHCRFLNKPPEPAELRRWEGPEDESLLKWRLDDGAEEGAEDGVGSIYRLEDDADDDEGKG